MKCPPISKIAVITDDAELAARLSCKLSRHGYYLPILDGPRVMRPDGRGEAVRRNNAIAKANVKRVALVDLSTDQQEAMVGLLPSWSVLKINGNDLSRVLNDKPTPSRLSWGKTNIGVGLLKALRNNQLIEFANDAKVESAVLTGKNHLVVCESGIPLSEVIAANYAYALNADLVLIPQVDKDTAEKLTEELYSLYDQENQSAPENLVQLSNRVRQLCPGVIPPPNGSITFFTSHIPYSLAFPEVPSTHLETYPDLGVAVLNGLAAGNTELTGIRCAILVDPGESQAPEVKSVARSLAKRGVFVRGYPWKAANVRDITNAVELFPYDFLLFATHCGDTDGIRFTYEFEDSSGRSRHLVVDTAIGVGHTDDPDLLNVMEFERFHELDGVSWSDPDRSKKLDVGTAIADFVEQKRAKNLKPVQRENIPRVLGSAALKMADHNYIAMPRDLADSGSPVIFNNACASWHQLSGRFMFAGARAYIGTLFPVTGAEAAKVAEFFVENDADITLAEALWHSQNQSYGTSGGRRPYVMTGVYPQSLHVYDDDVPLYIQGRLQAAFENWNRRTLQNDFQKKAVAEILKFYKSEIDRFNKKWRSDYSSKRKKRLFRP